MTYKVGIVGSGFGGTVHAPAYALHPQFEAVAIASPNRARAIADERKIPLAYPSLDAMLDAIGDQLDVISIASPPFDHHAAVLTAAAAKKHIVCEKPLGIRLHEVEEMAAAIERAGVAATVAFEYRYGSAQQALKELLDNGHLAPLRQIEVMRFGDDLVQSRKRPNSSWWYDAAKGGGLANAFMPHIVDMALWLGGGAVRHASGFLRTANAEREDADGNRYPMSASDGCFALAELAGGVAARMTVDGTVSIVQSTIALHAEGRTAIATGSQLTNMGLIVVENGESNEYELKESTYEKYRTVWSSLPQFMSLLDDFAERIATGGGNAPTFADGVAVQRVLHTIGYEAA